MLNRVRSIAIVTLTILSAVPLLSLDGGYHLLKTIKASESSDTWDFQTIDPVGRRLYASHFSEVIVVSLDKDHVVGKIAAGDGVHGVAIAAELGRGFITVGHTNSVDIFDTKTLKRVQSVQVGKNPDAIVYDSATKRVFSFNGDTNDATVVDATTGKIVGTIDIGGKPEAAEVDGSGYVYLDIVDKNLVLQINARTLRISNQWPSAPCDRPTSLAVDRANGRLFVGCRNLMLVVFDARDGHVVGQVPIGDNVDTTAFDPSTKLIFSSTGDGIVTVIHQDSVDNYSRVDVVKTHDGSKTMALDPRTHRIYVPAGEVKFDPPDTPGGRPKKTITPGTFEILVFGKS